MAKGNRGGRRTTTTPIGSSTGPVSYGQFTDNDATQLRNDVDDRYDANVVDAINDYISSQAIKNGYSASQMLNYALDNDKPLDATGKFIMKHMQKGMAPIGKDITMTRACHDDVLQALGIKDYTKLSEAQLQKKLINTQFQSKAFMSFSYDKKKNPFLTGPNAGGREVIIEAKTGKNTNVVFGDKSQAELITNIGQKWNITGVRYSGTTATPRNGSPKKQIIIEVETI